MADPTKVIKGGLSAVRNASRAADQALEAKRLALEAANPPIKASEAYGQHEGAYMKPIFYDRMKVDLSKGKKGGPGFSGIQLVDPNYADAKAVAGVTDQKMATRILNRNKAGVPAGAKVIWTPSVGGLEQHKSNSTMFGEFADIFANQRKNMSVEEIQKLSDRASNAVNNKGELIFPNGIDLGSRNFRQKVNTYDQRALMADIFAGRGVGGEKGRTVPVEDLLEKNLDPNVAQAGTLDLGNRLFRLEGNVIDRPDLHSDYRKILTGEDLNVNYIPVPIRDVYSDWEAQKALDLIAQGKNRGVTLMDYTKNDPTVQLTEELLTKMQKAGHKKGGVVERKETPEEMARFHERFALHKATGGKVDIPHLSLKKAKGGVHMVDGGKMAKGLMGVFDKANKAADAVMASKALPAAERDANLAKMLEGSQVKDRLYHGTKNDIKEFDLSRRGNSDLSSIGGGVYLTPEPNVASFYSKIVPGQSGANVMPVYAQVKNPYEYDLAMPFKSQKDANEFSRKLKEAGYDSIIKRDKDGQISELVVFEPNKIKSATGNRGTYDLTDPDINKADGGKIAKGLMGAVEKASKAADAAMAAKKIEAPSIIIPSKVSNVKEAVRKNKGDYGARRVERAADEIPNLDKLYKEEALKQAFLGDNAKAVMTMNPKDFEKYAAPLDPRFMDANSTRYTTSGERLAYPDYMSEYLPNVGAFDDVPFLEINKKQQGSSTSPFISGHEGRHRNRVMANKGEEAGLVLLNPRAELREPFPRRSQEDYIEALKKELEITGNKVKPENYFDNFKQDVIERKPIILPDIYAEGGGVHMVDGGKIGKGITGALTKASKMADEKIAADAIGKAAESAGMKAPVTANKPLTGLQDFHTSLGDEVRRRSVEAKKQMDAFNYKYDKGQRVFTEDSAKNNKAPYEVLERYRHGNNLMWEGEPWTSKKIIDPETGKAMRTPYEPGYRVRGEIGEMILPESAIKGSVDFARGGLAMAGGGNVLKGNIMAGASWNSINPTLADRLTEATGKPTYNAAVGATTSADTYKQLMDFIEAGGSFEQGSNVFLQAGGADFLKGVPRKETQENLDKILTELENQGVNVVLTGSPDASSYEQVISNNFNPASDQIYNNVVSKHSNVVLVDSMGEILQDKSLLSDSIHPNEKGWEVYNDSVLGALNQLKQREKTQDQGETAETTKNTAIDIPQEIEQITPRNILEEQYTPDFQSEYALENIPQINTEMPVQTLQTGYQAPQTYTPIPEVQEAASVPYEPQEIASIPEQQPEAVETRSGPDYSRAYNALGGSDVVNNLRDQFLGMGMDDAAIGNVFSKYYPKEYEQEFAQEQYKRGGAVGQESPEEMARFQKRFALHKATGGKINIPHLSLKKPKKFDDGGIASPSDEVNQGAAFGIYQKPKGGEDLRRGGEHSGFMAELLAKMAKDQGKQEVSSLDKPRAATDLLNRGVLANNPLSAMVDLVNMGLVPLDILGSKLTGRDIKVSSDKPFLGSEYIKDLMNQYGVTSGEERPMMETALSFASPTAMIKGAMKATDAAKKAPELMKKASDAFSSSKMSPLATEAKTATAGKPTGATYATKQEGPFFRVSPTTLDTSKAKTRGVREADELQGQAPLGGGAGSTGSQVPTRLADEEVARIIADPVANEPLNIAKKYTQETQGADFVLPDIPESSLVKQSAIGRAQQLAVEGSPEYKTAVFDAYAREMPDVLEKAGAKNYDDLMEKAYRQMAKETDDQFKALPYNFSYHRAGEGNYNSSKEMAADVHGNKHLYVYQGGDKHDFLNRIDPASGLNENEKFRAVHDLLGHAIYGNQFGPKGEEMAWAVHSQMYSPLARLAMTAETRGQNSMVNYSPLNANLKAELAKYDSMANEARRKGDKALLNEINAAKRQAYAGFEFAPNKAVLLPPEFLSPKYAGGMPAYLEAANRPVKGTETQSVLTHFSNDPNLTLLDPKRYGTGIKGAEAERLRDYAGGVKDRSYFYLGEPGTVAPEPGLGVNRYRGEASSLYDITQDPLNFQKLARESNRTPFTAKVNQGVTYPLQDANDVERLIKEYGYQGMANPKATKPMAIMFKETPVRRQARGGLTLMK